MGSCTLKDARRQELSRRSAEFVSDRECKFLKPTMAKGKRPKLRYTAIEKALWNGTC